MKLVKNPYNGGEAGPDKIWQRNSILCSAKYQKNCNTGGIKLNQVLGLSACKYIDKTL